MNEIECPYKLDILAGIGFDDEPGPDAARLVYVRVHAKAGRP